MCPSKQEFVMKRDWPHLVKTPPPFPYPFRSGCSAFLPRDVNTLPKYSWHPGPWGAVCELTCMPDQYNRTLKGRYVKGLVNNPTARNGSANWANDSFEAVPKTTVFCFVEMSRQELGRVLIFQVSVYNKRNLKSKLECMFSPMHFVWWVLSEEACYDTSQPVGGVKCRHAMSAQNRSHAKHSIIAIE